MRVFLLDDHELVRRGIRDLLWAEEDLMVVGEASTAAEALERVPQTKPDVAVLDVRLGEEADGMSGIEVCRELRYVDNFHGVIFLYFPDGFGRIEPDGTE